MPTENPNKPQKVNGGSRDAGKLGAPSESKWSHFNNDESHRDNGK